MNHTIKRNEIYYADLSPVQGSEQDGIRPVLIIQNDIGNMMPQRYAQWKIASLYPTHKPLTGGFIGNVPTPKENEDGTVTLNFAN